MPTQLPAPAYPGHWLVRRVSNAGTFRFRMRQRFPSDTLLQEDIALRRQEMASGRSLSMMSCWPGSMSEIVGSMPEKRVIDVPDRYTPPPVALRSLSSGQGFTAPRFGVYTS